MGEVLHHVETHLVSLVNKSPQVLLFCLIFSPSAQFTTSFFLETSDGTVV